MTTIKNIILKKLIASSSEGESELYSNKHTMTSKELVGQVEGFVTEIMTYYVSKEIPMCIGVEPVKPNGARIVVGVQGSEMHNGYACTVYAIAKRNKILENICDMFERGAAPLADVDWEVLRRQAKEPTSQTGYFSSTRG